jgi:hypothetical protein
MRTGPYLFWGLLGAGAIVAAAIYLSESPNAATSGLTGEASFRTSAILAGREQKNSFEAFLGGEVNAFMGGVEIDLRSSSMEADEATIEMFVMMGGINIRVPSEWRVVNEMNLLMGGIEDKSEVPADTAAKRLVLRGNVVMGGVEIRN